MGEAAGLMDPQAAVDQLFGEGKAQVVEAVTSTRVTETEVILINGAPVQLVGEDGESLKAALMAGRLPDQGLLSRVLSSVLGSEVKGITKFESEVNVKSRVTSRDTLSVVKEGRVVNERTREWRSDSESAGRCCETFTPSSFSPPFSSSASTASSRTTPSPSSLQSQTSSSNLSRSSSGRSTSFPRGHSSRDSALGKSSSGTPSPIAKDLSLNLRPHAYAPDSLLRREPCMSPELEESLARTSIKDPRGLRKKDFEKIAASANQLEKKPSIFGTVADEKAPRDNTRRGFPQTPKGTRGGFDVDGAHPLPEWALAEDDDNSLVYEEGVLVSGCLGALVLHATPTPTYYPDAAYLFAFLLSARLFIKPHDLLQKICNLGFSQQGLINEDINTINKDELGNFVPHMVQLLGEWSETFPYDFRDERMMVGVRTMTHRCIALQPTLRRDVTQVLHNLLNKLTQLERHEETLAKLSVPLPADYLPTVPDITEVCPTALVLAQQLTHIELERLSYIGPEEFVQAFAKDNLEATYKDLKKTNNLESYVQWFNRLSYLVATQACSPVKKKHRVRVIEMWIEVARECFNIGNFNSLMGVIAGLNMSPVARLKKTWSKVQTAKFSVLEHQMDPSSNFSSYRSTLKAAMWRSAGAIDERQKIVIPFFSLLVKDLYFLNEGCANRLPNGHINFDKFWQLAKQVTEFMAWKQVSCPFQKDSQVLHYLQTTPVLSETGLAIASFEGEGPENSYERERFKTLKSNSQQQQQAPN